MNPDLDLRRYNITDKETAIEFINLIVSKLPQLERVIKDLELKVQSAESHRQEMQRQLGLATPPQSVFPADANISVSDRLAGNGPKAMTSNERLQQMRQAAADEAAIAPPDPEEVVVNPALLPKLPAAPGQVGNLGGLANSPVAPPPPIENPNDESGDINLDDIQLDDEILAPSSDPTPPVDPPAPTTPPPVTPGMTFVDKPLKKQNRTDLNATAKAVGLEHPEVYDNNKALIAGIEAQIEANANAAAAPTGPSAEDTTGIGDRVAKATANAPVN